MASIEMQIITKRQIPKGLIETFNRQTSRDFTMKILTRYPQKWKAKDLTVDFPLKVIPQRLFYSTGTRFALCLARDELLTYAESDYVLSLDDFYVVTPFMVEILLRHLNENRIIQSRIYLGKQEWRGPETYLGLFKGITPKGKLEPLLPRSELAHHLWTGCMLFPMKALRKVNGWDLAFDGDWGLDDSNLCIRMRKAMVDYAFHSAMKAHHLKHPSLKLEKDDPPLGKGLFIINKEKGAKLDIANKMICLRRNPSIPPPVLRKYRMPNEGRAKYGLKEVEGLLQE